VASKELLGLRVAVYARFSSEGQREAIIDDQHRRCHEFVLANGGAVREELTAYSDVIRSAFRRHSISVPKVSDQDSGAIRSAFRSFDQPFRAFDQSRPSG
jgi:DNA invertase Pin-like site-specific DNA recombinase